MFRAKRLSPNAIQILGVLQMRSHLRYYICIIQSAIAILPGIVEFKYCVWELCKSLKIFCNQSNWRNRLELSWVMCLKDLINTPLKSIFIFHISWKDQPPPPCYYSINRKFQKWQVIVLSISFSENSTDSIASYHFCTLTLEAVTWGCTYSSEAIFKVLWLINPVKVTHINFPEQ